MQGYSHNHNHNQHNQQYQPGDIEELDGWKWQCYCSDGPPSEDWESDEKKMACCMICNETWGHVECYGYQEVYERDKKLWSEILFVCMQCSGADPHAPPSPYSQSQTTTQIQPTITAKVHQATVMDNKDNDDDGNEDNEDNEDEDAKQMELPSNPSKSITLANISTGPQTERHQTQQQSLSNPAFII